jgi:SAM-dependent methyltransferase
LPFQAEFDAAYCFGNSFAYFDDAGNASFLESAARSLRPGGRFLLQTNLAAESILTKLVERAWYEMGDLFFLAGRRYDPLRGRLDVDYLFLRGGTVDRRPVSYRIYPVWQIVAMLEQAGFAGVEAFASFEREPFALGSTDLLLFARRR